MPALSPTMSQGNIAAWLVKEGDEIAPGDILCDVETDKATMGWENQDDGYIAKLLKPSGSQDIPVGTPLAILVEDEADVAAFADYKADGAPAPPKPAGAKEESQAQSEPLQTASHPEHASSGEEAKLVSPAAKILLEEHGLTLRDVRATGPRGVLTKGDVLAAVAGGSKPSAKQHEKQKQQKEQPAAPEPAAKQPSRQEAQQQQQQQQPQSGATAPRQSGDSKIRAILAAKLLEEGKPIPTQWLLDWAGARQQ